MEFGLFIQGFVPGPGAHDTDAEHDALLREAELVERADRTGWKYVWVTEHHALTEYSHLSASDVYLGYLARCTERIHLGSGIFNLSPRVNHPVRNAERVAMLDHLTGGRFEFGTGRGAGSHEIATFNIHDPDTTRSEWDEVLPELVRMWAQRDYTFAGRHFAVDRPHDVLPKPYGKGHPALWVACGSPSTFAKAGGLGIGALGFNFSPIQDMQPLIDAYKEAMAECREPLGQFANDNVMITNAVVCTDDPDHAREIVTRRGRGYLYSLVCLYHDTIPKPASAPTWPQPPRPMTPEAVDWAIATGRLLCGTPEQVCEQIARSYEPVGVDQLVFGMPGDELTHDEAVECLELFGTQVIPEFDDDPVHRTTRYREGAVARHPAFAREPEPLTTIYTSSSDSASDTPSAMSSGWGTSSGQHMKPKSSESR
jgi:alkanesulfonate monooxygenase SsuD/methylene tetrahydromethanopterin reductase-like flavin-dependent oxidoreductase (luciferase family)